jgi:hypothetical protein
MQEIRLFLQLNAGVASETTVNLEAFVTSPLQMLCYE